MPTSLFEYLRLALSAGFTDNANPYFWAGVVLLAVFLSYVGSSSRHVLILGGAWTAAFFLTTFVFALGKLDSWLTHKSVDVTLHVLALGAAFLLIAEGVKIFRRWCRQKAGGALTPALPVFLRGEAGSQGKNFVGVILVSVISGLFGSLLTSLEPKNYYLYVMYYFFLSGGNPRLTTSFFAFYSLAPAFILACVVLAAGAAAHFPKVKLLCVRALSVGRILLAAAALSTGMGLIYVLWTTAF